MPKVILDCVSDTHLRHGFLSWWKPNLEPGDTWILVHAGDSTFHGLHDELTSVNKWLHKQPHHHKILIAGNHECFTDPAWVQQERAKGEDPTLDPRLAKKLRTITRTDIRKKLKNTTYLECESVEIAGLKFYGSPYSLRFFDWGYQLDKDKAADHWAKIPEDTHIVISHGPAYGKGDRCPDINDRFRYINVGDVDLLERCREIQPLALVCGHIHEGRGLYTDEHTPTLFVNASSVDAKYVPTRTYFRLIVEMQPKPTLISAESMTCPT